MKSISKTGIRSAMALFVLPLFTFLFASEITLFLFPVFGLRTDREGSVMSLAVVVLFALAGFLCSSRTFAVRRLTLALFVLGVGMNLSLGPLRGNAVDHLSLQHWLCVGIGAFLVLLGFLLLRRYA